MKKRILLSLCLCAGLLGMNARAAEQRYVGGDISLLPQYEAHNSYYKDANGKKINDNFTSFFYKPFGYTILLGTAFVAYSILHLWLTLHVNA